tara:strand:+ start:424 stop:705 length:282 start_codon:yes stop_codon:yes gene_type:complete
MAKKEEIVDLKPTSITEEQLKAIQDLVSPINQIQMEMGRMATQKHALLHQITKLQESLQEEQTALEKQYGKVNINIQTGEISYPEDEQVNKED